MPINDYLSNISKRFAAGNATEHTFRGDLQNLLETLVPSITATNEPKRIACGAPDYVITRKQIPVGYIEAKDIGVDLLGSGIKEQRDRYRKALDNLIFTDYLDFHFYFNGSNIAKVRIGEIKNGRIVPLTKNFDEFARLIKEFVSRATATIKSSKKLAEMMADKAKILAGIIQKAVESDEENEDNSTLHDQLNAFKSILIHDIDAKAFADIYAQTIAYGMFAARLHDHSLETFTRREAAELIPKTNPFLRKLFQYIAGYDLDTRIDWIVDALADLFRAADIPEILKNFGKSTQTHDPIMHFYETFLAAYDPKLRKSRGVFYTPEPVVDFIVRAVDDILKTEFDLPQGLADTSKTKIKVLSTVKDERTKSGYREEEKEIHRVQILDPATGTGTFLAQVIKHIYKGFENQQGVWPQYVDEHLIPRLNGFELLMASYAMAHLKLDLLLSETGYDSGKKTNSPPYKGGVAAAGGRGGSLSSQQRFRVYLTNALEEHHPDTGTLFASWLSAEANEANHIKRDTPVMVVIGNPPYSGESANKSKWIMSLMEDYKKEPGGKEKLKEKNSKFINGDEYKFLRYGQHFIEKNGGGVLAFINPHGFLKNPTFRGMRWHLLKTYDKIYTIDLHGNAKERETAPDGSVDENVFDIEQGVSINILIKTGKKKANELGKVFHHDLYGKRELKYAFLSDNSLKTTPYKELEPESPNLFFTSKDFVEEKPYNKGFPIPKLLPLNSLGLLTKRDNLSIDFDYASLESKISYFLDETQTVDEVCKHFGLVVKDNDKWDANHTRSNVSKSEIKEQIRSVQYRPFDNRKVFYNSYFVARSNTKVLGHFSRENVGLIICRQGQAVGGMQWNLSFITNTISDQNIYYRGGGTVFPLYLYTDSSQQTLDGDFERVPNLNMEIVGNFAEVLGIPFSAERGARSAERGDETEDRSSFVPIDILDYIYAVLHSPSYREKYKEFLKIDFPRVPYPKNAKTFWELVKLGGEIRKIHLLESPKVEQFITGYPVDGDNVVEKPVFKNPVATTLGSETSSVFINSTQYFSDVPEIAWNFYIGGYQPAQKWLKDRKGRMLSFEDIQHYQKIIVALTETDRLMREIDKIKFL